ncbi:AAA family ATPase [Chthonomonas calidirosea]|uniref:AAA family ATPase n=1 Tax=Chthonomonas calidirosea TaxID=454171 RepID=UPI0006EC71DC|nr:SMC family ATPase [Chthonomonas calidirosea]CEK15711.1 ATPase involved in DNA repair [Chthonomonas calidirosea]
MIPIRLSLKNFMSYGETPETLNFEGLHVACLSGENGNGKSALLDAITWALWGRTRIASQGVSEDDLIRLGAQDMEVLFEFELNGQRYKVTKKRKRGGGSEWHLAGWSGNDWISLSGTSQRETEKRLTQLLSMEYETFLNSAYLQQGRAEEFTRQTPDKRKQVLGQILGLERYDRLQELAREQVRDAKAQIQEIEGEINVLKLEANDLQRRKEQLQEVQASLERLREELAQKEREHAQLQTKLMELQTLATQVREQARTLAEQRADLQTRRAELAKVENQIEEMETILGQSEAIVRDYQSWQSMKQKADALEPQIKAYYETSNEKLRLEAELAHEEQELRHSIDAKWREIEQLEKEIEQRNRLVAEIQNLNAWIESNKDVLVRYDQLVQLQQKLERQEEALQAECDAIKQFESDYNLARQDLQHQIASKRRELAQLQKSLDARNRILADIANLKQQLAQEEQLEAKFQEVRKALEEATEKYQMLKSQRDRLNQNIKEINEILPILQQAGASCPVCASELNEEKRARLVASQEAKSKQYAEELKSVLQQGTELKERKKQLEETQQHLEGRRRQLIEQKARLQELQEQQRQYATIEEEIQKAQTELADLEATEADDALRPLFSRLENAQELLQRLARFDILTVRELVARRQAVEKKLDELRQQERENREVIEALQKQKEEYAKRAATLDSLQARLKDYHEVDAKLKQARDERNSLQQKLEKGDFGHPIRAKLTIAQSELARLKKVHEEYEQVKRQVEALEPARERFRLLESARAEIEPMRKERQRLNHLIAEKQKQVQDLEAEHAKKCLLLEQIEDVQRQCEAARLALDEVRQRSEERKLEEGQCAEAVRRAEMGALELRKKEAALKAWKERQSLYEHLDAAFGRKGVQALIIENTLPELEEEANEILRSLTDGKMQLRFEVVRPTKSKRSEIETLDIRITDDMGTRPYELFSGGEAFRISFAIRIALSRLLARRSGTRLQTLIMDEGFGSQDGKGRERLVEAIEAIKDDFEKILVITHMEDLKDAFAHRIEVTKDERGSHIHLV